MILVDTSVWVQHLRSEIAGLQALLESGEVLAHPFVIGELALGNLKNRNVVLMDLQLLPHAVMASHDEVLEFAEQNRLFGRGIGYVDCHLLAAARLSGEARLWTLDRRLDAAARQLGFAYGMRR